MGVRTEDIISSLASRLTRLDKIIAPVQRDEIKELTKGKSLGVYL